MLKTLPGYFLAAALAALPAAGIAKTIGPNHESAQAAATLKDFAAKAADAADQAAYLDANTRSPLVGWQSYTARLEDLKADINDMGRLLTRLQQMRAALSPVDREVLDRAHATLLQLADSTTAGIDKLNQDRDNFWTPSWHKYATEMVNESSHIANSINHAMDLDNARSHEQHLEQSLEAGQ